MNFSALSIKNPVPAILLFLILTYVGLTSLNNLGIQNFPDIEVPVITVSATLEGAAPPQLETEVARKIEDQIASIGGIEHVHTTITDGSVTISVEFNIDKNSEEALNQVRNAVDSARSDLPSALQEPVVSKLTTSGGVMLTYVVNAKRMNEQELSWYIDNDIAKAMLFVEGVGNVSRIGGVDRQIQVDLDPIHMAGLGVSASDVSSQLKRVEQDASGGRGDIGNAIQSVRTLGAAKSVADIANLEIPLTGGGHVNLNQVAQVSDTHAERTTHVTLDGKPVIGFQITRVKGSSEVQVAKAVREAISQFNAAHTDIQITEAFNTVKPAEDNYEGSMHLLYEGALLAVLVVWWFLRDWRATFVATVALPLSIIPTFMVMYYAGFSLNVLTLLALALVVGILVDDAIVEIENIVRHLRMGKTPYQAAMEAADEIGFAVIATTFTLVAVFLPTAFMGGIPGKFFKQFGITAAAAVMASLLVARLLTPMMAAYWLKAHGQHEERDSSLMRGYLSAMKWCLAHRKSTLLSIIIFIVASLGIATLLPTGFVPAADTGQTKVTLELQPGSTLQQTMAIAQLAEKTLRAMPEVTQVFNAVGVASSGGGDGPNSGTTSSDVRKATLTVSLQERSERAKQSVVENSIREKMKVLPGTRVTVGSGGSGEKLQVILASDDADALQTASAAVEQDLRRIKGLGNITSSASLQRPEIQITPDFSKAADLGITTQALADVIRTVTAGDFSYSIPKLNLPQRQVPILVRFAPQFRQDIQQIRELRVASSSGTVALSTVAKVEMGGGVTQISRLDRMRNTTLDIELGNQLIGDVSKQVAKLPSVRNLPPSVKQLESGDAQRMNELFGSFGTAMLIGVMCIYAVLVLLFHDFVQPVTILGALPLSLGGAFTALWLTGSSFSMPSVIGLLMLMGVVTKNSILLVEYAIMARKNHELNRLDALIDACRKRARPILMTTIAMGAGMLPIALGFGSDPSFRAPMAITVIGGLITSTFLSMLVIPVTYTLIDDGHQWVSGLLNKDKVRAG